MSVSLNVYYELEWKLKCPREESFLASWQGLALFSHSMLFVFLPVYAFTTYCILKKTPRSMSSVKGVLLNSHVWCCYMDIMVYSLITPYFYFPTISGFPVGLMTVLGVPTSTQIYVGMVSAMFMGNSLTALFENRSSCIPSNRFRMSSKKTRIVYYSVNCLIVVVYLFPPFLFVPEQESARISLLEEIPCPTEEFFYADVFVLTVDYYWKNYLWLSTTIMVVFIMLQIAFYSLCCVYYLFISTAIMISAKTRKYQKAFFLGTIAQIIVPLTFIAIPVGCAIISIYLGYYNQELNNSVVLGFSLHGCAADIVILLVHHPYRSFIVKLVFCEKTDQKKVSVSFVTNYERTAMRKLSNRVHTTF